MTNRPKLSVIQIAEQFDVSEPTIRRKLTQQVFPNASKTPSGKWIIPVDDILAAGYKPRKNWLVENDLQTQDDVAKLETVTAELADAKRRLEVALLERDHERSLRAEVENSRNDLRKAMLMLESSQASTPTLDKSDELLVNQADRGTGNQENPPKLGFWRRLLNG